MVCVQKEKEIYTDVISWQLPIPPYIEVILCALVYIWLISHLFETPCCMSAYVNMRLNMWFKTGSVD